MSCCAGSSYRWFHPKKGIWVLMADLRPIGFKIQETEPGTFEVKRGKRVLTSTTSLSHAKKVVEGRAGVIAV